MKFSNREDIIQLTPQWTGERFEDGRPKVSQDVIKRIRKITMEEAWGPLWRKGYKNLFVTGFKVSKPGLVLCGRAVTTTIVPARPDLVGAVMDQGKSQGHTGQFNQWVIDSLVEDDVIVCDLFDKVYQGTFIGGNLATAIATRTKHGGLVCWGAIRDLEQIAEIDDLQVYFREEDPSFIYDCIMSSFNGVTRINGATCLPGDIVLATQSGVIFIPAHLAEEVVENAERSQVRDIFGFERLGSGTYTGAQIDGRWEIPIFEDFLSWLKTSAKAEPYKHLDWTEQYEELKKSWEEYPDAPPRVTI